MSKKFKKNKAIILNNKAVLVACEPYSTINSIYKHEVMLKHDWVFSEGEYKGERLGHFRTAQDFLKAKPVQLAAQVS